MGYFYQPFHWRGAYFTSFLNREKLHIEIQYINLVIGVIENYSMHKSHKNPMQTDENIAIKIYFSRASIKIEMKLISSMITR